MGRTGQPPARPIIVFERVSKTYENGNPALEDVSFQVHPKDFLFVVGASGAGKSTMVRLLIREEVASRGHVLVDGQDLRRLRRRQLPRLRRKMGIVFQDYKLLPNLTVEQNVAFAIQVTNPGRRHLKEKVAEALYIVGLEDKLLSYPGQLSGGEQQRVAIARALIARPAIVLADEPTGNLDSKNSDAVLSVLRRSNQELKQTVMMITHNPEAAAVGDRILHMRDGELLDAETHAALEASSANAV